MSVTEDIAIVLDDTETTVRQPFVKMGPMNDSDTDAFSISCRTCIATGTTACTDCVVSHLLANDDGPIDLVTVAIRPSMSVHDRAIALFERAGMLDDPVQFVDLATFEHGLVTEACAVP